MRKEGGRFRERLSSQSGRVQKRRKRWRKQRRHRRTEPGWGTKEWNAQWCGTNTTTIQKDRHEPGPDGKERWKEDDILPLTPKLRHMGQGLWKQGHTILSRAQHDRWTVQRYHLGTNEEVFNAGLYASTLNQIPHNTLSHELQWQRQGPGPHDN